MEMHSALEVLDAPNCELTKLEKLVLTFHMFPINLGNETVEFIEASFTHQTCF